jgi:hypothetical protein
VSITHKRSRRELVTQVDKLLSGDEVQAVGAPRGKSYYPYFTFAANIMQWNM